MLTVPGNWARRMLPGVGLNFLLDRLKLAVRESLCENLRVPESCVHMNCVKATGLGITFP